MGPVGFPQDLLGCWWDWVGLLWDSLGFQCLGGGAALPRANAALPCHLLLGVKLPDSGWPYGRLITSVGRIGIYKESTGYTGIYCWLFGFNGIYWDLTGFVGIH